MADTMIAFAEDAYARLRNPGRIQTFGVLLVVHPRTLRVLNASENTEIFLGLAHADVMTMTVKDLFDSPEMAQQVAEELTSDPFSVANPLFARVNGRPFDLVAHLNDQVLFLELTPLIPGAPTRDKLEELSDHAIGGLLAPSTFAELVDTAPRIIQEVTGFDRVLLYKFDERFSGQVIGEARRPHVDSFLGLFFPESDIGAPARALYNENFCRYIPLITPESVRVVPAENRLTGRPLDMSGCVLRSVLPCHVEYLGNMSVVASMSFSIVVNNRLWGLFACHHYMQSHLSYTQRLVCEQVAMLFVARMEELLSPHAVAAGLAQRREILLQASPIASHAPLAQDWSATDEANLLAVVNADGAAIYDEGRVGTIGRCPPMQAIHEFIYRRGDEFERMLRLYDVEGLFFTNVAGEVLDFAGSMADTASGILVVPLSRGRKSYLFWFRPERIVEATWAGNPGKSLIKDQGALMSPRSSFAAWKQEIRGKAAAWDPLEIESAIALRNALLASSRPAA